MNTPDITFAFGAKNTLHTAYAIVKKRYLQGHPLVVWSRNTERLQTLDQYLWAHESSAFIPHGWMHDSYAKDTPIILATEDTDFPHYHTLLNLDHQWPPMYARFQHIIELVSEETHDKEAARARWRFYQAAGHTIIKHDLNVPSR